MRAFNCKHKPKHMVVKKYNLSFDGYYQLCYYDRYTKDSYTLIDNDYVSQMMKIY